jgi:hypothetical protein
MLLRDLTARHGAPDRPIGSYTLYADIGRPYVLWNVFATPELSRGPIEACFPLAGCLQPALQADVLASGHLLVRQESPGKNAA